jgi:hypothetical protein
MIAELSSGEPSSTNTASTATSVVAPIKAATCSTEALSRRCSR